MPLQFEGYALKVVLDELTGDRLLVFIDRNAGVPTHTFKLRRDDAVQIGHDLIGADEVEEMARAWSPEPESDQRVAVTADEPATVPEDWAPAAAPGPGAGEMGELMDEVRRARIADAAETDRQERTPPHGDAVLPPPPFELHDPYPPPYVPEEVAEDEAEQPES